MTRGLAILMTAGAVLLAGCGGKNPSLDEWVKSKLLPVPTSAKVALVQSHLPDERREALQAIAKDRKALKEESVVELFCLVARSDEDALVRGAAARGLARMEGRSVLETLTHVATNDKDHYVRADAVRALGRRVPPEGMAAVAGALKDDSDVDVRIAAAEALRYFRRKEAAETLVPALTDQRLAVARKAWESLRYMTGQDLPREGPPWTEYLALAEQPFARYGKAPPVPKGKSRRPHFTKGIGEFFSGLFKKDPLEAELE